MKYSLFSASIFMIIITSVSISYAVDSSPDSSRSQGITFVSDMPWVKASAGADCTVRRDGNIYGNPIKVSGNLISKGVCTHTFNDSTPADIVINIDKKGFKTFAAEACIDDTPKGGAVQFQVLVDGKLKAVSPIVRQHEIYRLRVDVRRTKRITLRALNGDGSFFSDHAVWGYARFIDEGVNDPMQENNPKNITFLSKAENKPGVPGMVTDFKYLDSPVSIRSIEVDKPEGDIDIKGMARWAMNYLLRSPRPAMNYEPIFSCCPRGIPPVPEGRDPIVDGDTDSRMDWEFYNMRKISGATEGKRIEEAFHKRIRGYLGKDDICWTESGCFLSDNIPAGSMVGSLWATTKLLVSLSLSYQQSHNPEDKALARKVFVGLRNVASREGKYAWYPSGFGPVDSNLKPIELNWASTAPLPAIEAFVTYWKTFGDPEALEMAVACTESLVDNYPKLKLTSINPDGSFTGHTHTTLHAMYGIAHLGVETKNPRYIEFAKRIYKFMENHGTGTGWVHEGAAPGSRSNCSETCTTSDVMSLVSFLAQSNSFMKGDYADYYDHLERYFRNHITPCQFFVTPKFEAYYRELHKDKPKEMVEKGINDLRKMEGGILAGIGINDYVNEIPGDERTSFILVGCCAPEGMRAIHTTWSNIVTENADEVTGQKTISINMSLPIETSSVRVVSYLPDTGRLTAAVKTSADFRMRPPAWVDRSKVKAWRDEKSVKPIWDGAYIKFENANPGEELTITYPLATYQQRVGIFDDSNLVATYTWKGNTAIRVEPSGKYFPMHTGARVILPPGPELPE